MDKKLELTTELIDLICDYLIKNNKCQDSECDNCIEKQAINILQLTTI